MRSFAHSSLISSTIRTHFAGWSGGGMLAQNSATLMFEFTFQVLRDGCISESNTTCVVRGGSVLSVVVAVIGVSGVVGVEPSWTEFWPSLCKKALLL